ncbi:acyl-coenzyme A thioesterase 9, mitochondrial-like isoform X2 [Cimex lectularius]|uniref:HotDog ACOT-type domain-containing protein n=1 Tax=Cimex lectularius TaxID=79782 RepID=A0A8I6RDV7_CIMLE|nr:acyl-coenzyme A thioesterase 9, mitochondrial-like isoform X2 [Cimex lectularius]
MIHAGRIALFVNSRPTTSVIVNSFGLSQCIWLHNLKRSCTSQSNQNKPNYPEKTMAEVKAKLRKMMGTPQGYKMLPANRSHLLPLLPKTQEELPVRTPMDSYDTASILLSQSPKLQDKYATVLGSVRIGRLLEDLDLFCVWISLRHINNPKSVNSENTPYTIVTAGVDNVNFTEYRPQALDDLRLSGNVIYAGKTSMEIEATVDTFTRGEWKQYIKAYFVMVARNSTNSGGAFINQLKPSTPEEQEKFKQAEERKKKRQIELSASLLKTPPSPDEQRLAHDKFMKTVDLKDPTLHKRVLPAHASWMDSTKFTNTFSPHPENRNHHNRVFGGFLMRMASELSWVIAFSHGRSRPYLCHISDFSFKTPVPMTAFMKLSGQMVYTELNFAQIVVVCEMFHVHTWERVTTNEFHYTYRFNDEPPEIMPLSYLDSLLWLDGRRHFFEAIKSIEGSQKVAKL